MCKNFRWGNYMNRDYLKSSIFRYITPRSPLKITISEEDFDSIFRVQEQAKQESSVKQVASRDYLIVQGAHRRNVLSFL
jgi:hypothetical protein